jgi:uncharacterized protein Yka (UPF0111/DUF47 family)
MGDCSDAVDVVAEGLGDAWDAANHNLQVVLAEAREKVEESADWIEEQAETYWDECEDLYREASELIDDFFEGAEDFWDNFTELTENSWDDFDALLEDSWDEATSFIEESINDIIDPIEQAWETITQIVENSWNVIKESIENAIRTFVNVVENAWEAIEISIEQSLEVVSNYIEKVAKRIEQSLHDIAVLIEKVICFIGDLFKSIVDLILKLGACLAGKVAYELAKNANVLGNSTKVIRTLPPSFKNRLEYVFSGKKFDEVMIVEDAKLVANMFGGSTAGMTFGNVFWYGFPYLVVIFLRDRLDQSSFPSRELMVHELVHALQLRSFMYIDTAFACAYGRGYAEAGFDYKKNPMEEEAYSFTELKETEIRNM